MIFEPITITWAGADYKIEPEKVMGAIATVEQVVTLSELAEMVQSGRIAFSKIATAFASVLRYAGAKVTNEDVYAGMFGEDKSSAMQNLSLLLAMMVPPQAINAGKVQAAPTGGKNSSKKPTN
jgi:hypothetical protein